MFDFVEKHRRWVMIVLLIVIGLAFSIVGLPMFDFAGGGVNVAEVGRSKISIRDFEQTLEQQRDRIRSMGAGVDPSLFETTAWRKEVLDQMIAERLQLDYSQRNHLDTDSAQIQQQLRGIPAILNDDGSISKEKFERVARNYNTTPEIVIAEIRGNLIKQQLSAAVEQSVLINKSTAEYFVRRRGEIREVSQILFPAGQYVAGLEIKPEELKAYYDAHLDEFRTPEQVRAEYVTLTRESIAAQTKVTPEQVQQEYTSSVESRIKEREAARAKADSLLAQLRKEPERFAELAKANSQDPGSAENGGDLGFFPRGSMVKPFEDAVFKMKPKQISAVVETDFGFHIIQLDEVKKDAEGEERRARHILIKAGPAPKDPAAAKAQIERDLRDREVGKNYGAAVEMFKDIAYDQSESLQGLVDQFKLQIGSSGWISRTAGPPPFNNPNLISALFAEDALKERRNTQPIDLGQGRWIAARVVEHKPAALRPFEEVRTDVERMLREEKAMALARKNGEEKLQALKSGQGGDAKWSAAVPLTRERQDANNRAAVDALFKADATTLPAYVGIEVPKAGYALYRITKVTEPNVDDARIESARYALGQLAGMQQREAFVGALRARADVDVNEDKIPKKVE